MKPRRNNPWSSHDVSRRGAIDREFGNRAEHERHRENANLLHHNSWANLKRTVFCCCYSFLNENFKNNETPIPNNSSKDVFLEKKDTLSIPKPQNKSPFPPTLITSPTKTIYIILIIFIFLVIGIIIFYKDMFIHFFNSLSNKKKNEKVDNTSAKVANTSAKVHNTSAKVDLASAKVETTSAKIDDLSKKVDSLIEKSCSPQGAVTELNKKLTKASKTSVSEDGYCYIGYDNGQRECVDVYAGDTCMSGEIFPTMDICINPKLKN
jgi:outer membrane murein-binding lipoprotein Lpp